MTATILRFLIVAAALVASLAPLPAQTIGTASISGVVTSADETRAPLRRVQLRLVLGANHVRVVDTDDAGRFVFRDLPSGTFLMTAAKGGYVTANYDERRQGGAGTPIPIAAGQQFVAQPIVLARGAVIAGRLLNSKGQPIANTVVEATQFFVLNGEKRRRSAAGAFASSQTNAHGEFRLFGLGAGEYVVICTGYSSGSALAESRELLAAEFAWADERARGGRATPPPAPPPAGTIFGYPPALLPGTTDAAAATVITLKAGEERGGVDFVLPRIRTSSISGMVTTADGAPVANAQVVRAPRQPQQLLPAAGMATYAGRDGRFTLTNVVPGDYILTARLTEGPVSVVSLWAQAELTIAGADINGVALQLRPGVTITGTLSFEGQAPPVDITRANVRLMSYTATGQTTALAAAVVARDGSFVVRNAVPPGTYRLAASYLGTAAETRWTAMSAVSGGRNILDVPLEVTPDQEVAPVVVTFRDRESRISGTIFDASGVPSSLFVLMFPVDAQLWFGNSRWVKFTRSGADGSFDLRGLAAGDYFLSALTELEVAQYSEPSFLKEVLPGAIKITLGDGETKTQNLRIGGG